MTTTRQYAAGTKVTISRSKEQVDAELRLMGAMRRAMVDDDEHHRAVVLFEREGVRYRLELPLLDPRARTFNIDRAGRSLGRTVAQMRAAWEQDCKERWRALAEYIKMLRVSWQAGIVKIEEALLAAVVLPDGQTVGEYTLPQLPTAYERGEMPPLLPGMGAPAPRALPAPREARGGDE